MMSDGILDKKILRITRVNITQAATIELSAPGIYMKRIHPRYYRGLTDLALWKGVLELSLKGTYITYPYLEYQYDRVQYLITTKINTEFLRILLLVA